MAQLPMLDIGAKGFLHSEGDAGACAGELDHQLHVVTGFTADGEFVNDVLYHGGMIFYRDK